MSEHSLPFEPLVKRILTDGKCLEGGILKVDSFINHQIDPKLLQDISKEFVKRFANEKIDKILTIEASGIAPAILVGLFLDVPVVFAKKKKPSTMSNMLVTEVFSFTKQRSYCVCVSQEFIKEGENILFIDDFLANGNAAKGIIDLINQAKANLVGMGFIIEKSFQEGGKLLRDQAIHVESLVKIKSLDNCTISIGN